MGGMFSSPSVSVPEEEPETELPDEEAIAKDKKRKAAAAAQTKGRESTFLSGGGKSSTFGG